MDETKAKKKSLLKHSKLRIWLIVMGSIFGFFVLVNIAVDNPWTHKLVQDSINEYLEKETSYKLDIQSISVSVMPPKLELFGFRLIEKGKEIPNIEAAHIKLSIDILNLFLGKFKISDIWANELRANIFQDLTPDQPNPTNPMDDQIPWPPPINLPISRVVLNNSNIALKIRNDLYPTQNTDIHLMGADIDAYFLDWNDFEVSLKSRSTDVRFLDAHMVQHAAIESDLFMKNNRLQSRFLKINSHDLSGQGEIKLDIKTFIHKYKSLKAKRLRDIFIEDLGVQAKLDLKDSNLTALGRFLGLEGTEGVMDGILNFSIKVPFSTDGDSLWKLWGHADIKDGTFDHFLMYDSKVDFAVDPDEVDFQKVEIFKEGQLKAEVKGTLDLSKSLNFDYEVSLADMSFEELMAALKVKDFKVIGGPLYSNKLKIEGSGNPFKLKTNGQIYIAGLITPSLNYAHDKFQVPPDCVFNMKLSADSTALKYNHTDGLCFTKLASPRKLPINTALAVSESTPSMKLQLDGSNYFDSTKGIDMTIIANDLNLGVIPYYAQVPAEGRGQFTLGLKGPYDDIRLTGSGSFEDAIIAGFPFGKTDIKLASQLKTNKLSFPSIEAKPKDGGSIIIKNATLELTPEKFASFDIEAKDLKNSFLLSGSKWVSKDSPFDFAIHSLEGQLKGPIQFPLMYQGEVKLSLSDGHLGSETIFSKIEGQMVSEKSHIKTTKLAYQLGSMVTDLQLAYDRKRTKIPENPKTLLELFGGSLADEIKAKAVSKNKFASSYQDLHLIPFVGPKLKAWGFSGSSNVDFDVQGSLQNIQGVFKIEADRLVVLGNKVAPLLVKGVIKGQQQIEIDEISQSGGSLLGKMEFDFSKPGTPYSWYFKFKRFDVRSLGTSFFYQDPRNYAYLSGEWSMKGRLDQWWQSQGHINIDQITAKMIRTPDGQWQAIEIASKEPVEIIIDESGWKTKGDKLLTLGGTHLNFSVGLKENKPPQQFNIQLSGDINGNVLRYFIPKLDTTKGAIGLKGSIKGTAEDLQIDLEFENQKQDPFSDKAIESLALSFLPYPPPIENIKFRAAYKDRKIIVRQFSATKGANGKIQLLGSLGFDSSSIEPSALNMTLEAVELQRLPIAIFNFDTAVSGDLVLSGHQTPYKLSGNLSLDKAHSYGHFDIRNQILTSINKRKIATAPVKEDSILDLDLKVTSNNTIKIRNRNIVANMAADLTIKGSELSPIILGNIDITSGKFFYKRDFKIRRGNLLFTAATFPPDPKIDIIADVTVDQYLVQILATGYASAPKVEVTIDPATHPNGVPISKVEILLLLTQGKLPPADQQGQTATVSKIAQREAANVAVGQIEQPIERLFDISGQKVVRQIYFDFILNNNSDLVPRINLPMRFTDDINLILQVDNDSNVRVSSEYAVHEAISFTWSVDKNKTDAENQAGLNGDNSGVSPETDSGVDLKFRFSFP